MQQNDWQWWRCDCTVYVIPDEEVQYFAIGDAQSFLTL